jgi:hypothetical protein
LTAAGLFELDIISTVGIVSLLGGNLVHVSGLTFLFVLLSNLRFIGVFGRMLAGGAGWHWRLAVMLGLEVIFATESAMFHNLLLWLLWTFRYLALSIPAALAIYGSGDGVRGAVPAGIAGSKMAITQRCATVSGRSEDIVEVPLFDRTFRWLSFLPRA